MDQTALVALARVFGTDEPSFDHNFVHWAGSPAAHAVFDP